MPSITFPWKWILAAIAGAAVVLAVVAAPIAGFILSLDGSLPGWGAMGVLAYAAIYAAAPLLMLPALPFGLGAGVLFGFWQGYVAVTVGSILTTSAGFLLSRHFLRHRLERRFRNSRRFRAIDRSIACDGWKIVGLLRLTWLHCGFSNYAYGLTGIRFRPYILISTLALVPGNVMAVYLGTAGVVGYEALAGGERERTTAEHVLWIVGAVMAVGATGLVAIKAKRAVEQAAAGTQE
jgi:uncharacterized membrane protein YdjX (TVP38/TMEM64 family)